MTKVSGLGTWERIPWRAFRLLAMLRLTPAHLAEAGLTFCKGWVVSWRPKKVSEKDGRMTRGARLFVCTRLSALWLMLVLSKARSLVYWWVYIFKCNFALDKIRDHPGGNVLWRKMHVDEWLELTCHTRAWHVPRSPRACDQLTCPQCAGRLGPHLCCAHSRHAGQGGTGPGHRERSGGHGLIIVDLPVVAGACCAGQEICTMLPKGQSVLVLN